MTLVFVFSCLQKQKADKEAEKEREIKELKAQLDHVRDINAGKKVTNFHNCAFF